MDFAHDQLATGRKIGVLTIVDTFSRYVPALEPRLSYRAEDVVRTLEQVCPVVGYPKTIQVAPNSSHAIPTCGPIRKASPSTFHDRASRRTTRISKR